MLFGKNFNAKNYAVFGGGASGKAVFRWCEENGVPATIYDSSGVGGAREDFTDADARRHDAVIYSPGFPPDHPWLETALAAKCLCAGEPDFAAAQWQERFGFEITAVTGTNGKTTLTEFLAFAHREAGRCSAAVGNNGTPFMTLLFRDAPKVDFPICEISSFQAERMEYFSPKNILWTNLDEDHLDRHKTFENYFRAKFRLVELQSRREMPGVCVVGESVAAAARRLGIRLPATVQVATREEVRGTIPAGSIFNTFPQSENYAIAKRYWLANGFPLEELESAARKFAPKAHRLSRCGVVSVGETRIEFWNDSKGTNFHAVYAALETFPQVPVFWIGGGLGKGGDLAAFCRRLAPKIVSASLIGATAPELLNFFAETKTPAQRFGTLEEAVCNAFSGAREVRGGRAVVLFSPGFASFDMFKSYGERGKIFETFVGSLIGKQ